jgi:hypothetical protein
MFREPDHVDAGPSQCPYCGTRLNASLLLCPECGAHQFSGSSQAADAPTSSAREPGAAERLREQWNALPGKFRSDRLEGNDYPSIDEETMLRSRRPRYVWAGLAVFAAAITGYAVLHHSAWEPRFGEQVVVGSVAGARDKLATLTNRWRPAPSIAAQSRAAQKPPAGEHPPVSPGYANARPSVARNLAIARASLDKNSLWPARRAITAALAEQPGNADAQQMRAELDSREQQRDALLGRARQCAHDRQWACVRQDAGHAVNVDTSSREAKHLLTLANGDHRAGSGKRHGLNWPWDSQTYAQASDARARQDALFWHH